MATHSPGAKPAPISFINCFDATVFSQAIDLDHAEAGTLDRLLGNLEEYGVLLRPAASADEAVRGLAGVLAHLRSAFGDHIVEAALAGAPHRPTAARPTAIMLVWPFEPSDDAGTDRSMLLSSGRLWGADVLLEAIAMESEDGRPRSDATQARYDRWIAAAGGKRHRQAIFPPGETGEYVLFGSTAPA